jgi:hypothetical protein
MLPNRIYTPAELRALAGPDQAQRICITEAAHGTAAGKTGSGRRWSLLDVVGRLFGRNGLRRSAPGTV